jgi:hypothetical protein
MKNNIQSARLAGFGSSGSAVELFVQETEFAKVNPVIEEFRLVFNFFDCNLKPILNY